MEMTRQAHSAAPGRFVQVRNFLWHFVQMVLVMNAGMMVYHLLYALLAAPLGVEAALRPYPAIRHLMMDLSMVVPMVALMRYQRAGWQYNFEMVAAMMAGPLVFVACWQLGLHQYVPGLSAQMLGILAEVSMYLGMLAAMLYRRDAHAHHGAH